VDRTSLRKNRLAARDQMEQALRKEKGKKICALLTAHPVVSNAAHLFIYVDFRSEVETIDLIRQLIEDGKTISVPVTLLEESRLQAVRLTNPDTQLMPGCYGIPEPTPDQIATATVDPLTIDTVLIPGSVFDTGGGRLGYGGGYYDRFLTESAPRAARVGVAFELQLVEQVPMEPHDQYMDVLVTEQQIYDCGRNRHAQDSSVSR
jgi:5-formyltetrahydrofolate cyclo-ligase